MAEIDIGYLSEAINNKIDRDGKNCKSPAAVVIESQMPTSNNGYIWYRKYSDGWVEQGGTINAAATTTTSLPIEMSDTNYQVLLTGGLYASTGTDIRAKYVQSRTTTSFTATSASGIAYMWQVSGIAK